MSTALALKLFDSIGKIQHLRTYEFLKTIEENTESDGFARITYSQWKNDYSMHSFILNQATAESIRLGFIKIARQNRAGEISDKGSKGTRKIYRLTLNDASEENAVSEKKSNPVKRKNVKKVARKKTKISIN